MRRQNSVTNPAASENHESWLHCSRLLRCTEDGVSRSRQCNTGHWPCTLARTPRQDEAARPHGLICDADTETEEGTSEMISNKMLGLLLSFPGSLTLRGSTWWGLPLELLKRKQACSALTFAEGRTSLALPGSSRQDLQLQHPLPQHPCPVVSWGIALGENQSTRRLSAACGGPVLAVPALVTRITGLVSLLGSQNPTDHTHVGLVCGQLNLLHSKILYKKKIFCFNMVTVLRWHRTQTQRQDLSPRACREGGSLTACGRWAQVPPPHSRSCGGHVTALCEGAVLGLAPKKTIGQTHEGCGPSTLSTANRKGCDRSECPQQGLVT